MMVAVGLAVMVAMKATGWVDVDWNALEGADYPDSPMASWRSGRIEEPA